MRQTVSHRSLFRICIGQHQHRNNRILLPQSRTMNRRPQRQVACGCWKKARPENYCISCIPDWPTRLYSTPILLNADLPDTQSTYTGSETDAHTGQIIMVGKDCPEKPAGNKLTNTAKKFTYRFEINWFWLVAEHKKQLKLGEFDKCPFQAEKPLNTN